VPAKRKGAGVHASQNSVFIVTKIRNSYKLHEDWIFVTASPEVFFPKDDGWNAEASFTISLDVYFSQ
jgi:hypothetical protein